MLATFDPNLSTLKDRARLEMGDVARPFLLADATYEALIGSETEITKAAKMEIARALSAICANKAVEIEQGPVRKKYLNRSEYYTKMADRLTNEDDDSGTTLGIPVGGKLCPPRRDHIHRMNRLNGIGSRRDC